MATQSKNKLVEEIKRDLFSPDDTVVQSAINRCREEGSAALVEPLIAFYASNPEQVMKEQVADMLGSLKVSNVNQFFITALKNSELAHVWQDLVSFMWNSRIQPVQDLDTITSLALRGNYMLTLECLTLLESLDADVPEEMILECISLMKTKSLTAVSDDVKKLLVAYQSALDELRIQNELRD
jgi:hypothetical protein